MVTVDDAADNVKPVDAAVHTAPVPDNVTVLAPNVSAAVIDPDRVYDAVASEKPAVANVPAVCVIAPHDLAANSVYVAPGAAIVTPVVTVCDPMSIV